MEYEIVKVTAGHVSQLKKEVEEKIKEGWRPQGGVAGVVEGVHGAIYQAMVRD